MENVKLVFLLTICAVVIFSGTNFNFNKAFDSSNIGYSCAKNVILNHQIADNGFNPNRKKKC